MKAYHICYHTDEDGLASASVIYEYLKRVNKTDAKNVIYFFYKIDYTMDLKSVLPTRITDGDEIYFVDYSFSNMDNLKYVLELSTHNIKVTWIDHHKTSEDIIYNSKFTIDAEIQLHEYENFYYLIDTSHCGAYLAYAYAYNRLNGCYVPTHNILVPLMFDDEIPLYIKYVDSWDTWKHDMPKTTEFNIGIRTEKRTPKNALGRMLNHNSKIINKLFSCNEEDNKIINTVMKEYIDNVIEKGEVIKAYQDIENESLCNDYGFDFTIVDETDKSRVYKCFALNKRGNSTMFATKINDYDIVVPFQFNGTKYVYSLYTIKEDVSCDLLAKKLGTYDGLGGGGHAQAAGFQTYNQLIRSNYSIRICNKLFRKDMYDICVIKSESTKNGVLKRW